MENREPEVYCIDPIYGESSVKPGLAVPLYDSVQQSRYIAAISKSLNFEGLASPIIHSCGGVETVLDFYSPDEERFFKVFTAFDAAEYNKFVEHPAMPLLIFDSAGLPLKEEPCDCCGASTLVVEEHVAIHIYDDPQVVIYYQGHMWKYSGHYKGKWTWRMIIPTIIRQIMEMGGGDCKL